MSEEYKIGVAIKFDAVSHLLPSLSYESLLVLREETIAEIREREAELMG